MLFETIFIMPKNTLTKKLMEDALNVGYLAEIHPKRPIYFAASI